MGILCYYLCVRCVLFEWQREIFRPDEFRIETHCTRSYQKHAFLAVFLTLARGRAQ